MAVVYTQITDEDRGIDGPLRTLKDTQATSSQTAPGPIPYAPPATINAADPNGYDSVDSGTFVPAASPTAATSTGFGASNDDQIKADTTTTSQIISSAKNGPIVAQPNVLDQYASYTYSLSWYILTPAQYNELASGQINMNKWMLLMQSGGAQGNVNDSGNGGRSPYFTLDYYMDNMVLETNLPGGGNGGTLNANNGGKLEFTVTEPNGLTLPNNLASAYQDAIKNSPNKGQKENYAQALYCMVIRFYGYDDAGNLMQAGNNAGKVAVQKIYPFAITHFDFRLQNRLVEYKIQATCPIFTLNASSRRGSIPSQFELVGKTVGDILAGNGSTGTQVTKEDGRVPNVAPSGSQDTQQAPAAVPKTLSSMVTGQDNQLATSGGMDFTAGNF